VAGTKAECAIGMHALLLALTVLFRPFSQVVDVCPTCTTGPQWDHVTLRTGGPIDAHVVAQNDAFYVLERYGELRAVAHDAVSGIEKAKHPDPLPDYDDQILFSDGIVLAGTIKADPAAGPDRYEITVPPADLVHVAPKSAISVVYQHGKAIYTAPATPPAP
jgi:hypothetical protein